MGRAARYSRVSHGAEGKTLQHWLPDRYFQPPAHTQPPHPTPPTGTRAEGKPMHAGMLLAISSPQRHVAGDSGHRATPAGVHAP